MWSYETKSCTPLWRQAHFRVKMCKAHQRRTTFGSWDVEKVHAVVVRSAFGSQNLENTPCSDRFSKLRCRKSACRCGAKHISKSKCAKDTRSEHFWKLWCRKSARRCGAKHVSKSKCTKYTRPEHFWKLWCWKSARCCGAKHISKSMYKARHSRSTFGSGDVEKVHAVVVRSTFPSQNVKSTACLDHFWRFRCGFAWQAQGMCTLSKVSKTWRFCSMSKNDGRHGTFEEDLQRCIFRGRRSTKDMFMRDVRRSGRWFPEKGCVLEHQICRFSKMILRDRCSTSYDLASIFRGRRRTLDRWSGKTAKRIGTRLSALHSTVHFWRKSRRTHLFLMLSNSKVEEVSQNCFVFDVVKF